VQKGRTGFTFIELLAVVAILAVLTAVALPVFRASVDSARKTVCLSNFRQAYLATMMYTEDYNETFMPVNYQPAGEATSKNDRTWVQLVLPYTSSYTIFRCPADTSPRPKSETVFDQDLVPWDFYSRYYSDSMRANLGFNYLYLSPIVMDNGRWVSTPRAASSIESPGRMLLYVDSVWDLDDSGRPFGGGSWLVIPPCRYVQTGRTVVDTFGVVGKPVYARYSGWAVNDKTSVLRYGGAWPWHSGRMTLVRTDGSASVVAVQELSAGCDVKENWSGFVQRSGNYLWDSL